MQTPEARQRRQALVLQRRVDWLRENGPCQICGSWEDLQVDHVDRHQKIAHWVWSWSEERRLAELAKCQVLCEPCHLEKTLQERGGLRHGTEAMYGKGGCRCPLCRAARSASRKANRARRKELGLPHQ